MILSNRWFAMQITSRILNIFFVSIQNILITNFNTTILSIKYIDRVLILELKKKQLQWDLHDLVFCHQWKGFFGVHLTSEIKSRISLSPIWRRGKCVVWEEFVPKRAIVNSECYTGALERSWKDVSRKRPQK